MKRKQIIYDRVPLMDGGIEVSQPYRRIKELRLRTCDIRKNGIIPHQVWVLRRVSVLSILPGVVGCAEDVGGARLRVRVGDGARKRQRR